MMVGTEVVQSHVGCYPGKVTWADNDNVRQLEESDALPVRLLRMHGSDQVLQLA